jgi:hypothetical protein
VQLLHHRVEGAATGAMRVKERPVDIEEIENGHGC